MKIFNQHEKTILNLFWRCVQIFSKQGISFLIFFICSKLLPPYEFGIYNYVLAFIFFLMMFGDFGISTATSKFVAQYSATDQAKLKAVLFNSGIIIFVLTVLLSTLVIIFGPGYFEEKYRYVLYILPIVFLSPMTSLYDGIYRGRQRFKELSIISFIVGAVSLVFIYILISHFGLAGALISQNIFYLLLLIVLASLYREFNFRYDKSLMREIGGYSLIYGLAIVGNYLFIRFGILILGHYNYIEQISVYEIINKIFSILLLPFSLLGQVLAPDFAVLAANNDFKKIYEKSVKYTFYFSAIGVVLGLVLYIVLPVVFNEFFVSYSSKSYFHWTFILCLITYITNVWSATFDAAVVIPSGYASIMSKIYIILGIIGALYSAIAVRYFGFISVFVSFAVCSFIMAVSLRSMFFISLRKRLGRDSKRQSS